jgi:hypothetical protein
MNKTLRFGYQSFAKHVLIKINTKISSASVNKIVNDFPDLWILNNGRHGFRIEGCLPSKDILDFDDALKLAIIDYKINALQQKAFDIEINAECRKDAFSLSI